jgi:GNAT superfamily N-acetyltransferase
VAHELLSQLGYQIDIGEVRRHYDKVVHSEGHAVFVAQENEFLPTLCHVYERPALEKPPDAIVQAPVVDQRYRGTGVGRVMMNATEAWAAERGFNAVALSSHVSRSDAHSCYEVIGYQRTGTSHFFRKDLNSSGSRDLGEVKLD